MKQVLAEIEQLKPWREVFARKQGNLSHFVSGLDLSQIVRLFDELAEGNPAPETGSETPLLELIRLSLDDLRTWYGEAAQGKPGKGSFQQINDWFWTETAAALLVAAAAVALENHAEQFMRVLATRGLVQRQYQEHLFTALGKS